MTVPSAVPAPTLVHPLPVLKLLKPAMSFTSLVVSVSVLAVVSLPKLMRSTSLMRLLPSYALALTLLIAVRSRFAPEADTCKVSMPLPPSM